MNSVNPFLNPFLNLIPVQRKAFISYFKGDQIWVDDFVQRWGSEPNSVFIPKVLGVMEDDNFVDSDDPEYILSRIRELYLEDSTVTIVLIGTCTHSRRFVDWEIKSSLRQVLLGPPPNGLMAILLPPLANGPFPKLPERFNNNLVRGRTLLTSGDMGYARYYHYPDSAQTLRAWIEDAYNARTARANLIANPQDTPKRNLVCLAHGIVHPV